MKRILKQILKDRHNGLVMSHSQAMHVQSAWLKLYGTGGCDCFPYTTEIDMFNDLLDHHGIVKTLYRSGS